MRQALTTTLAGFFLLSCSMLNKPKDDKPDDLLAAWLLTSACNLGGQVFTVSGSVSCTGGQASGTGVLTANSDSAEALSVQLSFQLASGGSVRLYGAGNRATLATSSAFYEFPSSGNGTAHHSDGAAAGADMGVVYAPGLSLATYCLEIHTGEIPPHLLGLNGACPAGTPGPGAATYDSEVTADPGGTGAKQGLGWGFQLNGATVTGVSVNAVEKFGHP